MEVLAKELEVIDGRVSGRLRSPNCRGPEKIRRILCALGAACGDGTGDPSGDVEMLALAHEGWLRSFQERREAERSGG